MFCGKCGTQVPDGAAACPNCGNKKEIKGAKESEAPQGAKATSRKKTWIPLIIVPAIIILAVFAVLLYIKLNPNPKGKYISGVNYYDFEDGTITYYDGNVEYTVDYEIKGNQLILDPDSAEFTDAYLDYRKNNYSFSGIYYGTDTDLLREQIAENPVLEIKSYKDGFVINSYVYFKADKYNVAPSGEYTCEDDDDITITFEDDEMIYNNHGHEETIHFYCHPTDDTVIISFTGFEFESTDFLHNHHTYFIEVIDDDEIRAYESTFTK